MAQHDYVIDNQSFPATRTDINNVLLAISSTNSGTSAPSTTYANQLWYDTTNNKLYIRNEDNDAWIPLFLLDQSNDVAGTLATEIDVEDASGTDTAGTALTVKGGAGTGSGAGGSIVFQTADGGSSGSSVNSHATRVTITDDGKVGIGTTSPENPIEIETANTLGSTFTGTTHGEGLRVTQSSYSSGNYVSLVESPYQPNGVANVRIAAMFDGGGSNLAFGTSNSFGSGITNTAMFIDSTAQVGVGTAAPAQRLHLQTGGTTYMRSENTSISTVTDFGTDSTGSIIINRSAKPMRFFTDTTERMRITDAGGVAIGATTTSNKLEVRGTGLFSSDGNYRGSNSGILNVSPNGNLAIGFGGDSDANYYAAIFHNSSNTAVGSIFVDASSTTYATSSDYRLKENVANLTGAIERVKALAPKRFNFIADPDKTVDGFLAHEAATVVPEAVQGEKDAMSDQQFMVTPALGNIITPATDDADEVIHSTGVAKPDTLEDGQEWIQTASPVMETRSAPDYQGIDQSKLVPVLTAALQEAIAKIEALETRVAALEG